VPVQSHGSIVPVNLHHVLLGFHLIRQPSAPFPVLHAAAMLLTRKQELPANKAERPRILLRASNEDVARLQDEGVETSSAIMTEFQGQLWPVTALELSKIAKEKT